MIDFNECVKKGLLKRVPASREKALQSIKKSKQLFEEAKINFKDDRINSVVIVAYLALFHAARALLFRDGFREKSHECIIRYLEEKYPEIKSEEIELLEKYKAERTHTQYDVSYNPNEEQAEKMLAFTKKFIETIEEIV
ncbi:HEPN domain-containing protein [Candidatus Micrarchaeota archaeon]|nr:HEPN domain-containing protein [Candidatus Micrarchaeota archaeon]MBU2476620.1 HEPN domain-containing protein [Candidatus Micrarchaeota archaeon]